VRPANKLSPIRQLPLDTEYLTHFRPILWASRLKYL
jgi:hypothetical protein